MRPNGTPPSAPLRAHPAAQGPQAIPYRSDRAERVRAHCGRTGRARNARRLRAAAPPGGRARDRCRRPAGARGGRRDRQYRADIQGILAVSGDEVLNADERCEDMHIESYARVDDLETDDRPPRDCDTPHGDAVLLRCRLTDTIAEEAPHTQLPGAHGTASRGRTDGRRDPPADRRGARRKSGPPRSPRAPQRHARRSARPLLPRQCHPQAVSPGLRTRLY